VNHMKRLFCIVLTLLMMSTIVGSVSASQDPYVIAGILSDQEGNPVQGATITLFNQRTDETFTSPFSEDKSGVNGTYSAELINLGNGFNEGDTIKVTATKDGLTASKWITVQRYDTQMNPRPGDLDTNMVLGVAGPTRAPVETASSSMLIGILVIVIIAIISFVLLMAMRKKEKDPYNS